MEPHVIVYFVRSKTCRARSDRRIACMGSIFLWMVSSRCSTSSMVENQAAITTVSLPSQDGFAEPDLPKNVYPNAQCMVYLPTLG